MARTRSLKVGLDATSTCHGSRAIHRYVVNLIRGLARLKTPHRYKLLRVNPTRSWVLSDLAVGDQMQVRDTRIPGRFLYPLWTRVGLPPVECFTGSVDLFHATDMEAPRPRAGVPLIWTVHGLSYLSRPDLIDPGYVARATGWVQAAVQHCTHFISVSAHTARILEEHFPATRGRITIIPLGVGSEFKPGGKPSTLVNGPYILFVGALSRIKNVATLVRAFEALKRRTGVPHKLVLAGPVDKAYWDGVSIDQCAADVMTLGHVDQDSPVLAQLYRSAAAFAFPSYTEGWTSPPLEAMASGVPVVTSNVSSLPETMGAAALQVHPDDVEALSSALERLLLDEPLRRDMIQRGLQHASQFTWDRMTQATVQVYEQVLA